MSGKVGGPGPTDPGKEIREQQQHRRVEKVEKVKEVGEVENEQTRKKFNRFMEEDAEKESAKKPSPFETEFYNTEVGPAAAKNPTPDLENLEKTAIPSPSYSPPPKIQETLKSPSKEKSPFPKSDAFWVSAESPKTPPYEKIRPREKKNSLPVQIQKQQDFEPQAKKDKEGEKKPKTFDIASQVSFSLPANIIPLATAATTSVATYLNSHIEDLFTQMVGTIFVMTASPGISRTEIVLDSPNFANSKFFGATISIEKYATAPDSLNICLTGSNEAVAAFNQNLPNLYAAFQNGNFSFHIGRLSAEYFFHRKRKREDASGGESKNRREP